MSKTQQPYGNWASPLSSELVAGKVHGIADVLCDIKTGLAYHVGSVPPTGAYVFTETSSGTAVTPEGSNSRTRCNEYGGGSAAVLANRALMSDFASNTVYQRLRAEDGTWSEAKEVVPKNSALRYADFALHPTASNLAVSVQEDHTIDEPSKVVNRLVVIDTDKATAQAIVEGADFYSNPRFDAKGENLLWLEYNLPYMPWERTILKCAKVVLDSSNGGLKLADIKTVEGSMEEHTSISQPQWLGSNIVALSDERGFNEPWFFRLQDDYSEPLLPEPPKRDYGSPSWVFNLSHWAPLTDTSIVASSGANKLTIFSGLGTTSVGRKEIDIPYSSVDSIRTVSATELVARAASPDKLAQVVKIDLKSDAVSFTVLRDTTPVALDSGYISAPKAIDYPTTKTTAHAYFYAPTNKDFEAASGEKPPLLVQAHGGPTSQASPTLSYAKQWWTSRGWAIVDVDYRGSTGFGKSYRDLLTGQWGIADTEDVAASVKYLVDEGLVDPKKVAIAGGSAGGYTVLNALCDAADSFSAGASLYGVADLNALCEGTHKFESEYLFGLIGGRPEQVPQVYHDRSPINKVDKIRSPLLVLQGSEDKVVPVDQAETIVDAVKKNGQRVDYILFQGEGHGFRQTQNVIKALEKQHSFFCESFGIAL